MSQKETRCDFLLSNKPATFLHKQSPCRPAAVTQDGVLLTSEPSARP